MTIRPIGRFLVALCLVAMGGCARAQAPEIHRYVLAPPPSNAAFPPNMPIDLGVISGGAAFREGGMAHQSDPYRLENYKFNQWVAPPVEMVEEQLAHLARQPVGVSENTSPDDPVMVLDAHISAFQKVEQGARSSGFVEIDFCLTQKDDTRPQWCKTFRRSALAYDNSAEAAAQAIGSCFNLILVDLAGELNRQAAIPRHRRPSVETAPPMLPSRRHKML